MTRDGGWDLAASLPDTWFELPLGRRAQPVDLDGQLDSRARRQPELAAHRCALREMLLAYRADAEVRGADAVAVRWELDDFDGASTATLHTYLLARGTAGPPGAELAELVAALAEPRPTDRHAPEVDIVGLTMGAAVRVRVVTAAEADPREDGLLLLDTVQYWMPISDHDDLALLAFATPDLAGAEALVAELDAIVADAELRR